MKQDDMCRGEADSMLTAIELQRPQDSAAEVVEVLGQEESCRKGAGGAERLVARTRLVDRLISDVQAGIDPERAYQQIFDCYYQPVVGFFIRRGFADEESHELAQETFVGVYRGIGRFRRDVSFEHWLFQISANIWRNELRRRTAVKRGGEDGLRAVSVETLSAEATPAMRCNPLTDLLDNERLAIVRRAIVALPEQMRRCMLLRGTEDMSYQEIAHTLRLSIETVRSHLFQARKRLRSELSQYFTDLSLID